MITREEAISLVKEYEMERNPYLLEGTNVIQIINELYDSFEAELQTYKGKLDGEVVAEFEGELGLWNGNDWLNNIENLVSSNIDIHNDYKVLVIRKDK